MTLTPHAGDKDNQVHFEGYQVSDQAMALVNDNCMVPTRDVSELGYIRESSNDQYVPDVFYTVCERGEERRGEERRGEERRGEERRGEERRGEERRGEERRGEERRGEERRGEERRGEERGGEE